MRHVSDKDDVLGLAARLREAVIERDEMWEWGDGLQARLRPLLEAARAVEVARQETRLVTLESVELSRALDELEDVLMEVDK